MTSINDCWSVKNILDYVKTINLLKYKLIIGGAYK